MPKTDYKLKYFNNEQIKNTLNSVIFDNNITKSKIAKDLNLSPQLLNRMFDKKHINCDDIKKILDTIDYELILEFKPKNKNDNVINKFTTTYDDDLKNIYNKLENLEHFKNDIITFLNLKNTVINEKTIIHEKNIDNTIEQLEQLYLTDTDKKQK